VDPGFTYLAIAYSGFFVVLAAFVVRLQRRSRELERDVESLQQRLHAGDVA